MADKFPKFAPTEMIASVFNDKEAYENVTRWENQLAQIEQEFSDLHRLRKAYIEKEYSGIELTPEEEEDKATVLKKIELLQTAGRTITQEIRQLRAKFTWQPRPLAADEKMSK